ncbi:MAG: hypothetical protein KatS3mg105_3262 [Gemmatales bacterium]|nr:MAG: hypothetical protein KatS3mg105_3262 [Gemmatales bacterium]
MDMENPAVIVAISVLATLFVVGLVVVVTGGSRLRLAIQAYRRVASDESFAEKVKQLFEEGPKEEKPSGTPLRALALLQREGRLLDFLLEDIQGYDDAQIGAAVRDIQRKCQAALKEHVTLEPILPKEEGETVEVPAGFDPSAIRLIGNVSGDPPFRGTLLHHGWRAKEIKLPTPTGGQDELVLMPAEVELP